MRYVLRRLWFFLVTLWAAATVNFAIPRIMPGNPAEAMLARYEAKGNLSPHALGALEVAFGIHSHLSILSAYGQYIMNSVTGHFGVSYTFFPVTVSHKVLLALPWTVGLVGMVTVFAFLGGTVIGVLSAWFRGGVLDSTLPPLFVILSAFPYFWVALLCVLLFGDTLGWLPVSGGYGATEMPGLSWPFILSVVRHSILPAFTILVTAIGGWILTMRNNMIAVVGEDYVRMARAKGLAPWKVMWGYAGRNAIMPNLTGFAMSLGFVVSGAVLVEYVFNYPGLGWMLLTAVSNEDYPLMQALFLLITVAVLVAVLMVDLLTALLDPRTRESV